MKHLIIFICVAISTSCIYGQEVTNERELTISVGLSFNSMNDDNLSAVTQRGVSPKYAIGYRSGNNKRISHVQVQFSSFRSRNGSLVGMNILRPQIFYSYEKKIKEGIWFGGFIDHNTVLNFVSTTSASFNNNSINYFIAQSIGPRVSYIKSFLPSVDGHKFQFRSSAQASLLAYVIQPEFAHPYPTQFLKEDVFTPTREGMAWSLVKSGKLATMNQYRSFRVEFGLFYQLNNNMRIGIDYNLAVLHGNTRSKAFTIANNDFMVSATYLH